MQDEFASIKFKSSGGSADPGKETYILECKSRHLTTTTEAGFLAKFEDADASDIKPKYKVQLKADIFAKMFLWLNKIHCNSVLKMTSERELELEGTLDKCPYLSLILETPARNI